MTQTVVTTSGDFVHKGFLAKDLRTSMAATTPSVNAQAARTALQITQQNNFQEQLITAMTRDGEGSLPAAIRQHVRNNTGDSTLLPAMERFHLNQKDDAQGFIRQSIARETEAAVPAFSAYEAVEHPANFLATKSAPWVMDKGVFTFTRKATIQAHVQFYIGLTVGGEAVDKLQWRLTDSGTNRIVIVTPTLHLAGNLAGNETMTVSLPPMMLYPEHYANAVRVPITAGFTFTVKDPEASLGRIDSMSVSLQRSTWVAKSTTNAFDAVVLVKRTPAGTFDSSNFVELTEL